MSSSPKLSLDFSARNSSPTRRNRRPSFGTFDSPNQEKPLLRASELSPSPSSPSSPSSPKILDSTLGKKRKAARRRVLLLSLAGGCIVLLVTLIVTIALLSRTDDSPKRNVILMISDGFGPASETFSRSYHQYVNNLPWSYRTPLDTILVGSSRTRSTSSLVTDSAAGATAFSCALKSYNAAISVDDDKKPCGTVLEAAKAAGLLTGLVATSRITHATPACFSAHVTHRDMENEIAQQQIGDYPLGRQVDLMMGGGRCHFMQKSTNGSCRTDERDLFTEGKDLGWNFITSRKEFDELDHENPELPLAALFTMDMMSYDMDRRPEEEPSLKEMAAAALSMLSSATQSTDKGFFIMIEGSRIDMAGHTKDAAAHAHDIQAYQDTIAHVKDFVDSHPGTVLISVSDHETGGLTLARQMTEDYPEYQWFPEVISRVNKSCEYLSKQIKSYNGIPPDRFWKETILKDGLGIGNPTPAELETLKSSKNLDLGHLENLLAEFVNVRAELGWTTHGHSGVDVNLYAYGAGSERLRGNHENTDIGGFIRDYLTLDLDAITKRLNKPEFLDRLNPKVEAMAAQEIMNDGLKHFHRGLPHKQDL